MNERIKEIAEQVWGDTSGKPWSASAIAHLEHFAELVDAAAVAREREACAKLCDHVAKEIDDTNGLATYLSKGIRGRTV
jgi:hypothetical protein